MAQPRKIVHFTSSLARGGAEQVLVNLLTRWRVLEPETEHVVLYVHGGPHVQTLADLHITTHQIGGWLFRYDPFFFVRLVWTLHRLKPDCMHTLLWMANWAGRLCARLLGIPVVCAIHSGPELDGPIRRMLDTPTLWLANSLIAVSQRTHHSLRSFHPARQLRRLQVVPNGIDVPALAERARQADVTRAELGVGADAFLIGAVGRFVPCKNYPLLLRAFAQLCKKYAQVRLVLLGYGEQEQQLRELAQALGIAEHVNFVIGQPAVGYYRLFDCFVQPSWQEGLSLALLEAMSFGVPPVATTDARGEHEAISHGQSGLLVVPNDEAVLVDALVRMASDEQLCRKLGCGARQRVQAAFTLGTMVDAYRHIIDSCARR